MEDVNARDDRGTLSSMTESLMSDTEDVQFLDITPSINQEGKTAPTESFLVREAASRDSFAADDCDNRWQGNPVSNMKKTEDCETVSQDFAGGMETCSAEMDIQYDCENGEMKADDCEFTRKGMCWKHKIKGTRIETKSKAWKKRKYDYGYVTTKKVFWNW